MINAEQYRLHAKLPIYKRHLDRAQGIIADTLKHVSRPYIAFSCGKDSTVLAHMVLQLAPYAPLRFLSSGETRIMHNVDDVIDYFTALGATVQEINIDRVFTPEWEDATWDKQRKAGRGDLELLNAGDFDCIFMGLRMDESRPRKLSLLSCRTDGLPQFSYRYTAGKRKDMVRCCPLANWTTEDVGAYITQHRLPYLDWYGHQGFEGRTTARLTGDSVRGYTLTWVKRHNPDGWSKLLHRFPEFQLYV